MEPSTSTETKCVLCGCSDTACLTIPGKGAVCLTCIKRLNTTVEELIGTTQRTVGDGSVRVDSPPSSQPQVAAPPLADFLRQPHQNGNGVAAQHFDIPFRTEQQYGQVVSPRRKIRKPESMMKIIAGGMAGIFLGLCVLHFFFKIDLWNSNEIPKVKKAPVEQREPLNN